MTGSQQAPLLIIAGPTASGKSALAMRVARKIGGEIISVDSMQVYRGMDIGTAKPAPEERAQVRHHLIDVVDISEPFDAAAFARLAGEAISQITARGHVPVLCGGTGLYFSALLHGVGNAPSANQDLRAELEKLSTQDLVRELEISDPKTFATIDQKNRRRLIRALEVIHLTGKPFSEQRTSWTTQNYNCLTFLCSRGRSDLHKRIDARVDAMFAHGLLDEVRVLLARGLADNKTAMQALGYRQVVEHLRGERSLDETINLIKIRTRQFSKRQYTWFRHQMNGQWLDLSDDPERDAQVIVKAWQERS